jgi:hypothetical protein
VSHQLENWLSPWGNANVDLLVDKEAIYRQQRELVCPLQDNARYLTESVLGHPAGYGSGRQHWSRSALADGHWLLGYNSFYDQALDDHMARGSVGAEAWGESLRLSANYYQPLGDWQPGVVRRSSSVASGYDDVTAQARLPFYQAH